MGEILFFFSFFGNLFEIQGSSKPSCDRYSQPPEIKPTPPCSPDDVPHAHVNIMAS